AVLANESNLKLRAREYYDLHPELLELATDPRQLVRYSPVLWLELKRKVGTRTKKRRLPIPKSEVDAFFETGTISESTRDLQQPGSHETLHELQELRERLGEPLRASCVVNYRRHAWQDGDGDLRVTLDQKLCCFAARPTLFAQTSALVRESLGTPVYEEADCVVEVKARGATPDWLDAALTGGGAEPCAYSKFVTASRAVYGER
ncbi:MAG TPA: VTC domain-containing protein, partial [Polyangiales bacterium]|nr:VTC domain-containing protein [Polyangiales bacterium]